MKIYNKSQSKRNSFSYASQASNALFTRQQSHHKNDPIEPMILIKKLILILIIGHNIIIHNENDTPPVYQIEENIHNENINIKKQTKKMVHFNEPKLINNESVSSDMQKAMEIMQPLFEENSNDTNDGNMAIFFFNYLCECLLFFFFLFFNCGAICIYSNQSVHSFVQIVSALYLYVV